LSPDSISRLAVRTRPTAARLADGPFEGALDRLVERRVQAARVQGAIEARTALGVDIESAVTRLDEARDQAVEQLAHTSIELALEITRNLLRTEIPEGRYDLEAIVREALSVSGVGRGRCTIHINPVDATGLADIQWRAGTELEPDPDVARGSVHITTPQGLLVRDLDDAMVAIRDRLLGDAR